MPLTSAMAASFVAQSGADEDSQGVHHFQWMGTSDASWVMTECEAGPAA